MTRRRFLKLFGFSLLLPVGLPTCGGTAKSAPTQRAMAGTLSGRKRINHEGRSRSYRIYTPSSLPNSPSSTVILLHGHGGSSNQLLGLNGKKAPFRLWLPIADRENLILIIPDGLVSPDRKRGWNDARNIPTNPNSNDVDFLLKLIETVAESYPIDFNRVYVNGMSNGGHMALRLAAEVPDKFAAVAAVTAANPDPIFPRQPTHPISVLLMNGTHDRLMPYNGGNMIQNRGRVQSTRESIQYWVDHNNCSNTPQVTQYRNRSRFDGCRASRSLYRNPRNNSEVALIKILRGGHTEPSLSQLYSRLYLRIVGRQNQDIEMADEIWKFFKGKTASQSP